MKTGWIVILVLLSSVAFASEGTNSGGGGQVVVCPDDKGGLHVEALDLWEAKKHLNPYLELQPIYSDVPVGEQVELGLQRLRGALDLKNEVTSGTSSEAMSAELMHIVTSAFLARKNSEPGYFNPVLNPLRGGEMPLTSDAYEKLHPRPPCEIKQAITFDDAGEIAYMDMDLIDHLGNTDLAALYLHEAFYKFLRVYSAEQSSLRVRRAVGYVMSGYSFTPISKSVPKERIECDSTTGSTRVYIYGLGAGQYGMSAGSIAGVRAIGYSAPSAVLPGRSLQDVFDTWLSPNGVRPSNLAQRDWRSPVDYDMTYSMEVKAVGDRRRVFIHLDTSPGKANQGVVEEVSCRIVN